MIKAKKLSTVIQRKMSTGKVYQPLEPTLSVDENPRKTENTKAKQDEKNKISKLLSREKKIFFLKIQKMYKSKRINFKKVSRPLPYF